MASSETTADITAEELRAIVTQKIVERISKMPNVKALAIEEAKKYFKSIEPQLPELLRKRAENECKNFEIYSISSLRAPTSWEKEYGKHYPNHKSHHFADELRNLLREWCKPRNLNISTSHGDLGETRIYIDW